MPDDVWRFIFGRAVNGVSYQLPTSIDGLKMSLTLSHVCSIFRFIVNNSSELWNRIPLIITEDPSGHSGTFLDDEIVRMALKRASVRPLTLNLMVNVSWNVRPRLPKKVKDAYVAISLFLEHIHLAKVISIDHHAITLADQYQNFINALHSPDHHPTLLEELHYHGPPLFGQLLDHDLSSEHFPSTGKTLSRLSDGSKNLKILKLYKEQGYFSNWMKFKFNFSQLTHLEIVGSIMFQALVVILSSTNTLQVCIILEIWDCTKPNSQIKVIMLPCLEKLCVRGSREGSIDSICYILSLVIAPSLKTLCLSECGWNEAYVSGFLKRSQFMLQELSLEGVSLSSDQLLGLLELLPHLEYLTFDMFFYKPENLLFAQGMMAWSNEKMRFQLCPKIKYLGIFYIEAIEDNTNISHRDHVDRSSMTPLSDMVEMRFWAFNGFLNHVYIFQFNPSTMSQTTRTLSHEMKKLLALKQEGHNISFELGG